jgi:hypothetical protein
MYELMHYHSADGHPTVLSRHPTKLDATQALARRRKQLIDISDAMPGTRVVRVGADRIYLVATSFVIFAYIQQAQLGTYEDIMAHAGVLATIAHNTILTGDTEGMTRYLDLYGVQYPTEPVDGSEDQEVRYMLGMRQLYADAVMTEVQALHKLAIQSLAHDLRHP